MRTALRIALLLGTCQVCALAGGSAEVELGRRLFMDPTVSRQAKFSCADCHRPEHGFSDPRVRSIDVTGETARHSQPLLDLKDGAGMHWDGEFFKVRELLVARLAPLPDAQRQSVELAQRHFAAARSRGADKKTFAKRIRTITPRTASWAAPITVTRAAPLARRLTEGGRYAAGFQRAFGAKTVTTERMVQAMEAYVLSLRSGTSPYDRYVAGDVDALSASARRGLRLFTGKADCASCHTIEGKHPRFTDDAFHNTGMAYFSSLEVDAGRLGRSFVKADRAAFKTPSLRDVARRAPYMHSGALKTLRDVVAYYVHGGTPNPELDKRIRPLGLDARDVDDLVAFLEALSSDERPGIGPYARNRGHTFRGKVEDLDGRALPHLKIRVTPSGDRLGRAPLVTGTPFTVTTDRQGRFKFRFPDWTHVTLHAAGYTLGHGEMLPDYLIHRTLIAAPTTKTVLRVRGEFGLPKELKARVRNKPIVFTRVRRLGDRHALYVSDEAHKGTYEVSFNQPLLARRRFEVAFGQGLVTMVDFRFDPNIARNGLTNARPLVSHAAKQTEGAPETVIAARFAAR